MTSENNFEEYFSGLDFSNHENSIEFDINGVPVNAYLYRKTVDRLFVMFNGAIDRKKQYPIFHRFTWHEKFPGSVLYIADPVLSVFPALTIGWYAGMASLSVESLVVSLVTYVAKQLGVSQGNIISYGSSAGGFASLKLAGNIDGIVSVAVNPQTNIFKFYKKHINDYMPTAWDGFPMAELEQKPNFNAIETFKKTNSRTLLVQNTQDFFHWEKHFLPFINEFNVLPENNATSNDGKINVFIYDAASGHGPESADMVPLIVEKAVALCGRSDFGVK